jgi:hypothetical protein
MKNTLSFSLLTLLLSPLCFADQASTWSCSTQGQKPRQVLQETIPYHGESLMKDNQDLVLIGENNLPDGSIDQNSYAHYFLDVKHKKIGKKLQLSGKNSIGESFTLIITPNNPGEESVRGTGVLEMSTFYAIYKSEHKNRIQAQKSQQLDCTN